MKKLIADKQFIIAIIALVLVFWLLLSSSDESIQKNTDRLSSLQELIDSGVSPACSFNSLSDSSDTNGAVLVAGGKMRGDFVSTIKSDSGGTVMKSHMIMDSTHVYIWSDGPTSVGVQMSLSAMKSGSYPEGSGPFDLNRKLKYQCTPANINESPFMPPLEVSFQDMSVIERGASDEVNTNILPDTTPLLQ